MGRYRLCENNIGMMPLMLRTMQNNLKSSITEITFTRDGDRLYLGYIEGGEYYRLCIGLYSYEKNILNLRGELYVVWAMGEAVVCNKGEEEYKIQLIPFETASVRRLTIKRRADKIIIEFSETPNDRVAGSFLRQNTKTNSTLAFGMDIIERRLGEGAIADILSKTFNPTLVGADVTSPNCDKILGEENKRLVEEGQRVRAIKALVDRFFKEEEKESKEKELPSIDKIVKKSISDILDKISGKSRQNEENDN